MIHRRWSLLTGPPAILAGVVGAVLVFNVIVFKDPLPDVRVLMKSDKQGSKPDKQ